VQKAFGTPAAKATKKVWILITAAKATFPGDKKNFFCSVRKKRPSAALLFAMIFLLFFNNSKIMYIQHSGCWKHQNRGSSRKK
jgi:hypothetical protein